MPSPHSRTPAPSRQAHAALDVFDRHLNGPGLLLVPVTAASLLQAVATPHGVAPDLSRILVAALLAWLPAAVRASSVPLLLDRAMQLRAVALLLALAAAGVLTGALALPGVDGPPDGTAAVFVTQLAIGGLVVGLAGCARRHLHYGRCRRAARSRRPNA